MGANADPAASELFYAIGVEDVQGIAFGVLGRKLSEEELAYLHGLVNWGHVANELAVMVGLLFG